MKFSCDRHQLLLNFDNLFLLWSIKRHLSPFTCCFICYVYHMLYWCSRLEENPCAQAVDLRWKVAPARPFCRPRCAHGFLINIERTWHIIDSQRDPELVSFMMFSLKWSVLCLLTHHVPCAAFKSRYNENRPFYTILNSINTHIIR